MSPVFSWTGFYSAAKAMGHQSNQVPHGPSAISGRVTKVTAALAHKGHS